MEIGNRNYTIDIFRLVASFLIVFLHVGYGSVNEDIVALIRISGRWGVPFFFMLSGFFLQANLMNQAEDRLKKSLTKIFYILIVSNLAYILFQNLIKGKFDWDNIFPGTYFHLWFLPSLAIGTVSVYIFHKIRLTQAIVFAVVFTIILVVLIFDSYSFVLPTPVSNLAGKVIPLLSIPFMNIGANFYRRRWPTFILNYRWATLLIIIGLITQIIEIKVIHNFTGRNIIEHQFLIGTGILTIGVFILAFSLRLKNQVLGMWGKEYSLFIYLYHPALILLFYQNSIENLFPGNYIIFFPVFIFILTLVAGIGLNRFGRPLFKLLTGDFSSIKQRRDNL